MNFADLPDPIPERHRIDRMPLEFEATSRVPTLLAALSDKKRRHFIFTMARSPLGDGLQVWVIQEMGLPPHYLQRLLVMVSRADGSQARVPTSDELWNVRRAFYIGDDCDEMAHVEHYAVELVQRRPNPNHFTCPGTAPSN